jgi:hypothetical protein
MMKYVATVLTVIVVLIVGFLLLDLVGILLAAPVAGLGTGQIVWRLVLVCASVVFIAGVLVRRRSR